jgi:hypothetical protein
MAKDGNELIANQNPDSVLRALALIHQHGVLRQLQDIPYPTFFAPFHHRYATYEKQPVDYAMVLYRGSKFSSQEQLVQHKEASNLSREELSPSVVPCSSVLFLAYKQRQKHSF